MKILRIPKNPSFLFFNILANLHNNEEITSLQWISPISA